MLWCNIAGASQEMHNYTPYHYTRIRNHSTLIAAVNSALKLRLGCSINHYFGVSTAFAETQQLQNDRHKSYSSAQLCYYLGGAEFQHSFIPRVLIMKPNVAWMMRLYTGWRKSLDVSRIWVADWYNVGHRLKRKKDLSPQRLPVQNLKITQVASSLFFHAAPGTPVMASRC